MVKVKKDLKGKQFGHLIVIDQVEDYVNPKGFHFSQWLCQCECGQTTITRGAHLIDGTTQSCGCLKKQKLNNRKLNNKFDLNGDFGIGYTTKGEEFWFDKEDYYLICEYCWRYDKKGYVVAYDKNTKKVVKLHRLVMGVTDKKIKIDHKSHPPRNEHKYDNRKSNLQMVDDVKNAMNRSIQSNNTSGVTGVIRRKKGKKWAAYIQVYGKRIYKEFNDFNDAINARKEWEIIYFGEHRYNFNN